MNQFVKPIPTKNVPKVVAASIWLFALGAPAFVIHTNLVEAARREAQSDLIAQVATTIKSPGTSRTELLNALEQREKEVSDGRYIRTANRLGVSMDWPTLFAQIRKRGKAEQQKAAQIIAEECGLAPDSTLKSEQIYLSAPAKMVPMSVFQPVPMKARL